MRIVYATLIALIEPLSAALAQQPDIDTHILTRENNIDRRLIGEWENSGKGGPCQYFPQHVTLPPGYVPKTNRYTTEHLAIEGFEFVTENEMIYAKAAPDGWDKCKFQRTNKLQ